VADLGALLDDLAAYFRRYVAMTPEQADTCALYAALSHTTDAFDYLPYLALMSAEARSGKSTLTRTLSYVCARSWVITGRPTEPVLFRKIERDNPSLFIDECDRIFDSEHNGPLYAILNSGNEIDATVPRPVPRAGPGEFDIQDFSVFCPKTLAGIGRNWPDTIVDRCIIIALRRKTKDERVERARRKHVKPIADPLHDRLEAWADDGVIAELGKAEPWLPEELHDRAQDGWEPLLAIADAAGGSWPDRARRAALALTDELDLGDSPGIRLLTDCRTVFRDERLPEALGSETLLRRLHSLPEGGWRRDLLDTSALATTLKPYGIRPDRVYLGGVQVRGYRRADFEEAWLRYAPQEDGSGELDPVTGFEDDDDLGY
jgi:hypothetical protein